MGYHAQASRIELQNEYVELILNMVYKALKAGKDNVSEAVDIIQSLGLSNENMKEHLMGLSMDAKLNKSFDDLDTQIKSAFTREYNKRNTSNTTGIVKKIKGQAKPTPSQEELKNTNDASEDEDALSSSSEDDHDEE